MLQLWQEMARQERVLEQQKRWEVKELESSNAQGCVASTSDDDEILYNEATTVLEGRKRLSDV